jgi:hypothetical protein
MTFWLGKKLIREDRWFKVFEMQPSVQARVSKFMTREADIRETELKEEWVSWRESERLTFAQAFSAKPEITQEDERILEFMMHSTDERVWASVASCLTRHSNKEMVLSFLTERLRSGAESKANFLQALSMLGDREAIPAVKALHDRLAADIRREGAEANEWLILDFVVSCSALNKLEGTTAYRDEIEPFLSHPSEHVRKSSKIWFDGGPPTR